MGSLFQGGMKAVAWTDVFQVGFDTQDYCQCYIAYIEEYQMSQFRVPGHLALILNHN